MFSVIREKLSLMTKLAGQATFAIVGTMKNRQGKPQ